MRYFFLIGLISCLFAVACKNSSKAISSDQTCKSLTVVTPDVTLTPAAGVTIEKAVLKGDCLTLKLRYEGCEKTSYALYHNGRVKKSLPPQLTLVLQKDEEYCDAVSEMESEVCYNLDPLKSASEGGKIVVKVHSYSDAIIYEY